MRDEVTENIIRALEYEERKTLEKKFTELQGENYELNKRLTELQNAVNELEKPKKTKKDGQFTHSVQILILEYLGFGKFLENKIDKADIYASLIRRDAETTRQLLSGIEGEKNEKNLETIYAYFTKAGYPDKAELVKNELDRLKKKKSSTTQKHYS
jgi:hypothetical protein